MRRHHWHQWRGLWPPWENKIACEDRNWELVGAEMEILSKQEGN